MKITYAIWQGSNLLSVNNIATNINDIDKLIADLNKSEIGKQVSFKANIQRVEVQA
jgi:hypothetical protein